MLLLNVVKYTLKISLKVIPQGNYNSKTSPAVTELPDHDVKTVLERMNWPRTTYHDDLGGRLLLLNYHPFIIGPQFDEQSFIHAENSTVNHTHTAWAQSSNVVSFGGIEQSHPNKVLLIDIYPIRGEAENEFKEIISHVNYHIVKATPDSVFLLLPNNLATDELLAALEESELKPHKYKSGYFLSSWVSKKSLDNST